MNHRDGRATLPYRAHPSITQTKPARREASKHSPGAAPPQRKRKQPLVGEEACIAGKQQNTVYVRVPGRGL